MVKNLGTHFLKTNQWLDVRGVEKALIMKPFCKRVSICIQDEICLKSRLQRQWQITRDPAMKAEVNRLQRSVTRWLNEWKNDQWSATLKSLDPEDQSL